MTTTTATPGTTAAAKPETKPATGTALAKPADALAGTFHNAMHVHERLQKAAAHYHLVSPATSCSALPEGCGVAFSVVRIDPARETYGIPFPSAKTRGLGKTALDRISAAAGISWDPHLCRRLDNAADPHFVHYKVVGRYRAFDGTETIIQDEKIVDLREGSSEIDGHISRAISKAAKDNRSMTRAQARADVDAQVREQRMHILSLALTKARLRAIRSLGIRTSYDSDELETPFAVARVMFTGQTKDPVLKAKFAEMTASAFLFGGRAMYGDPGPGPALPPPSAPPALPAEHGYHPPPVGSVPLDYDDVPETPTATLVADSGPARDAAPARSSSSGRAFTIPGGRDKGKPLSEADASSLTWWAKKISDGLEDGSAKYPDKDRALLVALREEQARRAAPKADAKPVDVVNGEVDESRLPREPGDEEQPPLPLNGY